MPERSSICLLVSLLSNRSHNVGRSSLFPKVKRAIHSTAIAPLTLTLSRGERLQTQYSPTPDDAALPFRSRTCNCNGWYFSWRMRSPILAGGGRVELTYLIQPTILFNSRPTTAMGAFQSQRRLVAHVAKKARKHDVDTRQQKDGDFLPSWSKIEGHIFRTRPARRLNSPLL